MKYLPYRFTRATINTKHLIVGTADAPNPIADRRTNLLPMNKMRVGDSLVINKGEVSREQITIAKTTMKRYNGYAKEDFCLAIETERTLEIVRIK